MKKEKPKEEKPDKKPVEEFPVPPVEPPLPVPEEPVPEPIPTPAPVPPAPEPTPEPPKLKKPVSKELVVAYAREAIGTPTGHQKRLLGKALDCVGVVLYVADQIGMDVSETANYGRIPNPAEMRAQIDKHLIRVPITQLQIGDVVWLSVEQDPQHLGIIADYYFGTGFSLIHAQNAAGVNKVVEHRLDSTWKARIRAAWRFPLSEK